MTDPAADAVKLLPCPSVICPSHHPAWDGGDVSRVRDETLGYRVACAECDASTGYHNSAAEAVNTWNTRPQPAPPEGEPDGIDMITKQILTYTKQVTEDVIRERPVFGEDGTQVVAFECPVCKQRRIRSAGEPIKHQTSCPAYAAPPAGEPDFNDEAHRIAKLYGRTRSSGPLTYNLSSAIVAFGIRAFRLGLAARPKVEDGEVLTVQLAEVTADRDEWKQQHENLVGVRETDIANLAAKIDGLKAELDRRKGDPRTRLHNLCEALQDDLNKSPYTREEWEQVDRETVELQRKLRAAEVKLAEREAELAKAEAVIADKFKHFGPIDRNFLPLDAFKAIERHAARQQQKASAEPTALEGE